MEIKDLEQLKQILFEIIENKEYVLELFHEKEIREQRRIGVEKLEEWLKIILRCLDVEKDCGNYIQIHCPFHPPMNIRALRFTKTHILQ